MHILHCICDDKFIKGAMELFNADQRHNNIYAFVQNKKRRFHEKYIDKKRIVIYDEQEFLNCVDQYDVIILHNWFSLREKIICKIPKQCQIVWLAWGFDLYNPRNPIVPLQLYDSETFKFLMSQTSRPSWMSHIIDWFKSRHRKSALARVDFFSGVYPYEYELLKRYHREIKAIPMDFYYGSMNFFIKDSINLIVNDNKKDIIIGNSADPTNNHYEILTRLSKINLDKSSRIIAPLSYGGNKKYIEWIKKLGNSLFPKQFNPLEDYLPLEEYTQLVSNCRFAIYAHKRQQASDNILMQIQYGANVFLSEESLALRHFKGLGLKVFSIEADLNEDFQGLTYAEVINNRKILSDYYGQNSLIKRVKNLNDILHQKIDKIDYL